MNSSMMKKIMKKAVFLLLAALAFVSCQEESSPEFEYIPFRREYSDNWGLISLDGKILFENKYSSCPSPVFNGIFMLKGEEGYEFYTAEEEPKKVAGPYKMACPFTDIVTPVVTKEGDIQIIDCEGKVIKELNEIDGKEVKYVDCFKHGKASFGVKGSGWGVIDRNGEVCIPPVYYFGLDILENGYLMGVKKASHYKDLTVILDNDGEVIDSLEDTFNGNFINGKYFVTDGYNSNKVVDVHGNEIIPSEKGRTVTDVLGDVFVLNDWEGKSLVNAEGKTLLKGDFLEMKIVGEDRLLLNIRDKGVVLADYSGKELTEPIFRVDPMSRYYDGKIMPVKRAEDFRWIFVDKDGKPINDESYKILEFDTNMNHLNDYFVYH